MFREPNVFGERTLGKNPIVKPYHTFLDMLRLKTGLQFQWLLDGGYLSPGTVRPEWAEEIAEGCYAYARERVDKARPILRELSGRYPMVLVSNFYGNIETVLKDFELDGLFGAIVESAVVGIRKPDPAIFRLGVERLGVEPREAVVVGDSYDKDIVPATQVGCQTVWLKNIGWAPYSGDETADAIIADFADIRPLFQL